MNRYIIHSICVSVYLSIHLFISNGSVSGKNDDTDWVKEQQTSFTQWINQQLKSSEHQMHITDLRSGLKDGLVLIELMKIVAPQSIQFIR